MTLRILIILHKHSKNRAQIHFLLFRTLLLTNCIERTMGGKRGENSPQNLHEAAEPFTNILINQSVRNSISLVTTRKCLPIAKSNFIYTSPGAQLLFPLEQHFLFLKDINLSFNNTSQFTIFFRPLNFSSLPTCQVDIKSILQMRKPKLRK